MKQISLDPSGRLMFFSAVPEQITSSAVSNAPIEWHAVFSAAGLNLAQFTPSAPKWVPPVFADSRLAWEGKYPSNEPLRVEAAAYRGQPVYFHLIGPWTRPSQMEPPRRRTGEKIAQGISTCIFLSFVIGGVLLARRNVSLGRGDRRGAWRVATFMFLVTMMNTVLYTTHVSTAYELGVVIMGISGALFFSVLMGTLYLALEPYVRRRWPHALIASGKVLAGRFRDPLVGRDVLIGSVAGVAVAVVSSSVRLLSGPSVASSGPSGLQILSGPRFVFSTVLDSVTFGFGTAFLATFLLFALRVVVRKDWIAAALVLLIGCTGAALAGDVPLVSGIANLAMWSAVLFVMTRFGLVGTFALAYVVSQLTSGVTDFTSWHSYTVWIRFTVIAAMAIGAFYISLAGRPVLREALFET